MFSFSLQPFSETFLILRRNERDTIKKIYIGLHVKYPLCSSDFNKNLNFLDIFSKNHKIQNFVKMRPVEAEMFHTDRWTDITQLIAAFRNSAKEPKN